jgi:hypothetical protein
MGTEEEKADMRRLWREGWLGCIEEFGDYEMQRATWLNRAHRNPHYSFVEYMCCYFDDHLSHGPAYSYAPKITAGLVSAEEVEAVAEFHALAEAYKPPTDDYDHDAILADPKWRDVVAAARTARDRLLPLLSDEGEIQALTERSIHALDAAAAGAAFR